MSQHLSEVLAQARIEAERLTPQLQKAIAAGGLAAGLIVARKLRRGASDRAVLADPIWQPADEQERRRDADLLGQLAQMRHQAAMNTISNIR
jgi:hypothetical protein